MSNSELKPRSTRGNPRDDNLQVRQQHPLEHLPVVKFFLTKPIIAGIIYLCMLADRYNHKRGAARGGTSGAEAQIQGAVLMQA